MNSNDFCVCSQLCVYMWWDPHMGIHIWVCDQLYLWLFFFLTNMDLSYLFSSGSCILPKTATQCSPFIVYFLSWMPILHVPVREPRLPSFLAPWCCRKGRLSKWNVWEYWLLSPEDADLESSSLFICYSLICQLFHITRHDRNCLLLLSVVLSPHQETIKPESGTGDHQPSLVI